MALDSGSDDFLAKAVEVNCLMQLLADHLNLEWIYAPNANTSGPLDVESSDLILPPKETLERLLEPTQLADLKTLCEQLESLVATDNIYLSFAEPIFQLAKQFKAEEIEELLEKYIAKGITHAV